MAMAYTLMVTFGPCMQLGRNIHSGNYVYTYRVYELKTVVDDAVL